MSTKNDNCLGVHTNRTQGIWVTCTQARPCEPCEPESEPDSEEDDSTYLFDSPDYYGYPEDYPEDEDDLPPRREW